MRTADMRLILPTLCLVSSTFGLVAKNAGHGTDIPSWANVEVETDPENIKWPWRTYKSSPHKPPNMTITGNGNELAEGYHFMTPQTTSEDNPTTAQNGGFVMTNNGDLVFARNVSGMTDFRVQVVEDKSYITYWSGYNSEGVNIGHGYGQLNFLDDTYQETVLDPDLALNKLVETPVANWSIDIHEHQRTPRNTILLSAYNNTEYDLSSVGGPTDGWLVDGVFFEVDPDTWEILFSWKALDHIPLSASHQPVITLSAGNGTKEAPWDWIHINSIQMIGDDYLVNSRHHWAAYLVSGKDGSVLWSLEGEDGGSFGELPEDGTFRWQHFARGHNVTQTSLDLSFFDNHNQNLSNGTGPSKAIVYHLELPPNKSSSPQLIRHIETPSQEFYAESQGSYEVELSNGNQLVGFGQIAVTREYGPATDGSDLRWEAQFGWFNTVQSYRAFKEVWHATPAEWDPSLFVEDGKAYVSWNGDTETSSWGVYTGQDNSNLACVGLATKKGFETVFAIPSGAAYVQVAALQEEKEVRKSKVVAVS